MFPSLCIVEHHGTVLELSVEILLQFDLKNLHVRAHILLMMTLLQEDGNYYVKCEKNITKKVEMKNNNP